MNSRETLPDASKASTNKFSIDTEGDGDILEQLSGTPSLWLGTLHNAVL